MDQLEALRHVTTEVLGDRVLGAYRYGSAVAGGLRPASDIDLLVVTRRPMHPAERHDLVAGVVPISGAAGGARPLEVTVVVQNDVRPWRYPPTADLQFGEWLLEEIRRDGPPRRQPMPTLAIELTQVLTTRSILLGPPPEELLDPVPATDVARACLDGIPALLADLDGDERNVLLTFARIWLTLSTGRILPKDEAAAWAISRLPPTYGPVMEHARQLYLTTRYTDEAWPTGLREQVRTVVDHIIERLDGER